jgi:hypothetical protein
MHTRWTTSCNAAQATVKQPRPSLIDRVTRPTPRGPGPPPQLPRLQPPLGAQPAPARPGLPGPNCARRRPSPAVRSSSPPYSWHTPHAAQLGPSFVLDTSSPTLPTYPKLIRLSCIPPLAFHLPAYFQPVIVYSCSHTRISIRINCTNRLQGYDSSGCKIHYSTLLLLLSSQFISSEITWKLWSLIIVCMAGQTFDPL